MSDVKLAESDADIGRCFAVMRQLRPHLKDEAEFIARVRRQIAGEKWHLAFVEDAGGAVAAMSGFRLMECLFSGKTLYVDDLVTAEDQRGQGFGEALMRWMQAWAKAEG